MQPKRGVAAVVCWSMSSKSCVACIEFCFRIGQYRRAKQTCRLAAALLLLGLAAQAELNEPFGLPTVASAQGQLWNTWRELQMQMRAEQPVIARCGAEPDTCTSAAALQFIAIVKEGEHYQGLSRIGRINRAANYSIRQLDTTNPRGVRTRWSSPLDTLAGGGGDCKQYAVVKYAAMREAGFAPDDVRLVILGIRSTKETHAVVVVREGGRWVILDNRTLELADSRDLRNYLPLFALDHRGVWQFVLPPAPGIAAGPCEKAIG
jgi:predicted transglutaminase-like cysteine proteinase